MTKRKEIFLECQAFFSPDKDKSMAAGGRRSSWLEKPAMRGANGNAPALAWWWLCLVMVGHVEYYALASA